MKESVIKSKVLINNHGVIEAVIVGDQTANTVSKLANRIETLAKRQHRAGKPAVILDNLFQLGTASIDARRTLVERLKEMDYDKFAFVSHDRIIKFGANLVLQAVGKFDKVKFFSDYDEAIQWLTAKN